MNKVTSIKKTLRNKVSSGGLFAIALLSLTTPHQQAKADQVWDGGGGTGLWSNNTNWGADTAPNYALALQFDGLANLLSTNDDTFTSAGLVFNVGAGAFTLDGNAITLTGGITNNSANVQTISFGTTGITLGAGQTWDSGTLPGGGLNVTSAVDLAGQALVVDGANNTNISGPITDTGLVGSIAKNGTGTLTTSSLLNTYAGTTTVNTGTFNVLGTHTGGGTYTIAAGATLAGTGIITEAPGASITNNGSIVVGDANALIPIASTFTVNTSLGGAITMGAGSTLAVDLFTGAGLGNNTAVLGSSDVFNLGGSLNSVAGGTLVIGNPTGMTGFTGGDSWKVVNLVPGSITGNLGLTGNLDTTALNLAATQVGNFNQNSGVFTVIDTITGLQMANAMGQAVLASTQSVLADVNGRLFFLRAGQGDLSDDAEYNEGVVNGQGDGYGKNPAPSPMVQRRPQSGQWQVFATANYNNARLGSLGPQQAGIQSDSWTQGIGAEVHVTPNVALGFALNWLESRQTFANNIGSMDMNGYALSAYTSYVKKAFWADLLYNFGSYDLDTNRNPIGFAAARGDTNAYTNTVQFNSGWNFRFQNNSFVTGPFIGLDYTHVSIDAYGESGGGLAALAYNKRTAESLVSRIGWSASKYFTTDFAVITAQARLSYERQNLNNNSGTTVGLINQPFVLSSSGQNYGQDYMVAGAGLNFQFTPNLGLLLNYQGQYFRQSVQAHYVGLRLSYRF